MRQSRLMSLVEAVTNVAVGLLVAVATQIVVFPILGVQASLAQNLKMALEHLRPIREFGLEQARRHRDIVSRFGRHPHQKDTSGGVRPRRKWTT